MHDVAKIAPAVQRDFERQLRQVNEALLVSSVHQHELTEKAEEAEHAAAHLAETLGTLVDQSPFGTYIVDSQFRIAQVSSGAQPAFRNVRPLIGRDFAEAIRIIWPEPFANEVIEIFRHTLATGEPYVSSGLTEQRRDTGATESYEWRTHRVALPDGQPGVVCYFFDATQLRRAEQALRESEARYRDLFNSMDQGYCVIEMIFDEQGKAVDYRFLEVNRAFEGQSGMREVTGRRMLELVPSIEEHWLTNYGHVARTGTPRRFANEFKALNRWFDVYAFRAEGWGDHKVAVLFTDITERRRIERAAARLAAIVTSSEDAIISKDLDGIITSWNQGARQLFGYTAEEAIGQPVTLLIPEDHIDEEPEILQRIRSGESIDHYETVRQRKDGSLRDISLTISPLRDAAGRIIGASKIARDVTEAKRAALALLESEERYRTLFDLGPVAIYSIDASGVIQQFNRQAATLWGREPALGDTYERFCGAHKLFRTDGSFMPHAQCPMADVVSGKTAAVHDAEVLIERPDGSRVTVVVNIRPLKNPRGEITGAINCFYDITERKQAQEALRRSEESLAAELEATRRLHEVSTELIHAEDVETLYEQILDTAVAIMHSDFASIQMLHPERGPAGELQLLGFRGFNPEAAKFWEWVRPASESTCGVALRLSRRVIVPDIEACEFMAGSEDLTTYRATGIRAIQTTPLLSRTGKLVGMISTHWRQPHQPDESDLRLLEILARQAADLIERKRVQDALATSERRFRSIFDSVAVSLWEEDFSGVRAAIDGLKAEGVVDFERYFAEHPEFVQRAMGLVRVIDVNDATVALFEAQDKSELLGSLPQIFVPESMPVFVGELTALAQGRTFFEAEAMLHTVRGKPLFVYFTMVMPPESEPCNRVLFSVVDLSERRQHEQTLGESEERFRSLVSVITDVPWVSDADGAFVAPQPAWEAYTGQTWEQYRGFGWADALHEGDRGRIRAAWQRACESRTLYEADGWLWHAASQRWRYFTVKATPVFNADGSAREWVGAYADLDDQRQAEDALRESIGRFRQLADSMPQIVWTARPDGYIDYYNERWYEFTGFPRDQFGQSSWEPVLHPDDVQRCVETYFGCIEAEKPFQIEYRFNDWHMGGYRWFIGRALPIRNERGEVLKWFGTCTDIDEQKRLQSEREEILAGERAARSEAERESRLKEEFLATLSHELRTPLNAILGWAQLIKRSKMSAEDIAQGIDIVERNARAQAQLIEDLLDISRITSGKLRLDVQTLDVSPVVEAAVAAVEPTAEAKQIRIQKSLDVTAGPVKGDPARLQQVIWNLLTNAIKFTPKGGRVLVGVARVNSHVEITVSDTGQGIQPEFLPFVFERFRQADATTTRQFGGLGLGLSIVKHLVELHAGDVRVKSRGEGQGASFTVRLPLLALAEGHAAALMMPQLPEYLNGPIRLPGITALVVDDEEDARALSERVLTEADVEVRVAGSAMEALRLFEERPPDILISDIGMSGEDGYDLIRRIRSLPAEEGGTVPAIALTAYARSQDRTRAILAGYNTHISKPVQAAELVAVAAGLLGRTSGRQAQSV